MLSCCLWVRRTRTVSASWVPRGYDSRAQLLVGRMHVHSRSLWIVCISPVGMMWYWCQPCDVSASHACILKGRVKMHRSYATCLLSMLWYWCQQKMFHHHMHAYTKEESKHTDPMGTLHQCESSTGMKMKGAYSMGLWVPCCGLCSNTVSLWVTSVFPHWSLSPGCCPTLVSGQPGA